LACERMPEVDESHELSMLLGTRQIGVGVTETPTLLLESKECKHAGAGLAASGEIVTVKTGGFATEGNGGEIEGESSGIGKHQRCKAFYPALQQGELLLTSRAIGIGRGERFLGENVEPSK